MTHLKLPSTIASRQMNLLFDAKRSEGMSSAERDKVVLILAQILMQAAVARQRGFVDVEIIDDDLGRSASGTVARPGFDRLVAWLCAGKVGAVLCFDASRLARNGRDWHHLLELCGLVEARVIDLDGVYK